MLITRPSLAAAFLSACCAANLPAPARAQRPAPGPDAPPRSMTDTIEYCDHLGRRFNATAPGRPGHDRAAVLAGEGAHLCRQGHMRPGILRLRRALMLLDAPPETTE